MAGESLRRRQIEGDHRGVVGRGGRGLLALTAFIIALWRGRGRLSPCDVAAMPPLMARSGGCAFAGGDCGAILPARFGHEPA